MGEEITVCGDCKFFIVVAAETYCRRYPPPCAPIPSVSPLGRPEIRWGSQMTPIKAKMPSCGEFQVNLVTVN
jgi:hypothetical protein